MSRSMRDFFWIIVFVLRIGYASLQVSIFLILIGRRIVIFHHLINCSVLQVLSIPSCDGPAIRTTP